MSIWSVLKRGLGTTDAPTRPAHPSFEHLEPRLLLSADPAGLAGQISPDFLDDQGAPEAAIVVDFAYIQAVDDQGIAATEADSQQAESGSQTDESAQDASGNSGGILSEIKDIEVTVDSTSSSSSDASLPVLSAVEGTTDYPPLITDYRLPATASATAGTPNSPLLKSEYLKLNTPYIDSHTEGSIEARGPPTEIVFIDSSLNRNFQLESAVSPGVVVSVFDASADGIQHITDVLSSYSSLSAIHIVSHGAPGLATLGAAILSTDTLEVYTGQIRNWGDALTPNADILFYGCNLAEGQVGQALVARIAELTGADVAASTDPTGASDLGGDWALEYQTGSIETSPIPSGFGGLLALDTAGEVAFIGYNADGNDDFAIVALDDVDPNTVVYFTDNEWDGSAFNAGEGSFGWDSGGVTIAAGTVITFSSTSSGPTPNIGSLTGGGTGSINLNAANEGLWAYLGTDITTPTTFLAAIFNDFASSGNVLTNSNLVTGSSAVAITGDEDIMAYNGPRSGEAAFSSYLSLIGNAANWITQDDTGDQSNDTIAPDVPFDTTALNADPSHSLSVK